MEELNQSMEIQEKITDDKVIHKIKSVKCSTCIQQDLAGNGIGDSDSDGVSDEKVRSKSEKSLKVPLQLLQS